MRQEDIIKEKYGTDTGFSVPEGYFEALNVKILRELPPYPEAPKVVRMSSWQRMKPYVYLAAMFAGIWLMMNVFHNVSAMDAVSLDNPPEAIASAMMSMPEYDMNYVGDDNDFVVESDVSNHYSSIEEFQADFGYEFQPQYASMEVEANSSSPSSISI